MIDISNYATIGEDGKIKFDTAAFDAELQSEMDRARTQASETATKNAEKNLSAKIRKELEEEAKMTAEEKLKADRAAFLEEKKAFDRKRIETIYKDAGMDDEEIKILTTTLVGDNSEQNIETAMKLAEYRKSSYDKVRKDIETQLQFAAGKNPPKATEEKNADSIGKKMAEKLSAKNGETTRVDLSKFN